MKGTTLTGIFLLYGAIIIYGANNMIQSKLSNMMNNTTCTVFVFWLYILLLQGISKIIYIYKKDSIYKYTIYLVNNNQSIWTTDYPLKFLLPWNFIGLLLTEYNTNCDREYVFLLNNWIDFKDSITCNKLYVSIYIILQYFLSFDVFSFIFIILLTFQFFSLILYLQEYYNLSSYLTIYYIPILFILDNVINRMFHQMFHQMFHRMFQLTLILQIITTFIYLIEYNYQSKIQSFGSTNQNAKNFPIGKYYIERPLVYLNLYCIVVPAYLLYSIMS